MVELTQHFMFTYDSLKLADLKAEFGVIRKGPRPYFGDSRLYGRFVRRYKPEMRFYYGYCGMPIVTWDGIVNPALESYTYKLTFSSMKPWSDKNKRDLANPEARVGASAVTGKGAKTTFGIPALSSIVLIDNNLYKRMTLRDVCRGGSCGLKRQNKNRLIWYVYPIGVPTQEVVDSLLEKVV